MTPPARPPEPAPDRATLSTAKMWALAVIAACQLLVVLSSSVVNIALPQAQRALDISDADRAWVITAYALGVGGLLLLGGRIADYAGRRRVLIVGLVGFAAASAVGGAAVSTAMLLTARAGQGVFAALVMPAALSLLSVTFTAGRERALAFSVYGAMSAGGGAVGLVLGGVLTQYTSWRWCLLLSVPFALLTATAAVLKVADDAAAESRAAGHARYDIAGAVTVAAGLTALVYALSTAARHGWASATTLGLLGAAVVLLVAFVVIEARSARPMLPLRVVADRTRAGALVSVLLAGAGLLGMFLFLTFYLQGTLGYSPLQTGLAFLPSSAGILLGSLVTNRLLARVAPRTLLVPGMVLAGLGLWWLSGVDVDSSYWLRVAPAVLFVGVGLGLVLVTAASTALIGVSPDDAGVASAAVSTSQQIGGALGTALLNTVAATATAGYLAAHPGAGSLAAVHGYQDAFGVGAILLGTGALICLVLVRARSDDTPRDTPDGPAPVQARGGGTLGPGR